MQLNKNECPNCVGAGHGALGCQKAIGGAGIINTRFDCLTLNKRQGAIIMAFTGVCFGCPSEFHKYAEEKLGRSVFIHEFASEVICDKLKEASRDDFIALSNLVSSC